MFQFAKVLTFLAFFASFSIAQNNGPVAVYGALKACTISGKGQICGSGAWANTPVIVKGVSLGWSNTGWESSAFFNATTVNAMVDGWKAEIVRVPYGENDDANWTRVKTAVDAAIAKGVYVVIDWHSHNAETQTAAAKTFFETKVAAYHNNPHVIFEIFNEPINQTWAQIKSYSETIISAIRAKNATNLILVGTPEYSIRPAAASGNYLSDNNVAYVFHFYADTHLTNGGDFDGYPSYTSGITTVLSAGKPVFVSEWGTTNSDGGLSDKGHFNTHNPTSSDAWLEFMDRHKLSSCAWNVNDKNEGSAFFGQANGAKFTQTAANYTNKSMMSASGAYIYDKLVAYAPNALWKKGSLPPDDGGGKVSTSVIDDFEDGDGVSNTGEDWYIYTDEEDQNGRGGSFCANEKDEDGYIVVSQDGTNWVAQIKNYSLVQGENLYGPYIAIGLDAVNNQKSYDLSKCTDGFSYRFKGAAHNFKVQQSDVEDFSYHFYQVGTASDNAWKEIVVALADLQRPSWGRPAIIATDMKKVTGFSWELKGSDDGKLPNPSALTGSLMIDDFTCLGNEPLLSPIIAHSKAAKANAMQLAGNGISLQLKSNATLEIFNINGTSIRKMNFSSGTHSVKLQDLPKGLYIAKIRYGNSSSEIMKVPIR